MDGVHRELHTFAGDVGELLDRQGVTVGPHDVVTPAPGTALHDDTEIEVGRGRLLSLVVDERPRKVWTTARTVDDALRHIGVRAEGAHLSASRAASIGRDGLSLEVRTERAVTFLVDGRRKTVRTNAASVRKAAEDAGITLKGKDTTSVRGDSFPRGGQKVSVLRISETEDVREEPAPFPVRKRLDPDLSRGTRVVEVPGKKGVHRVTYLVRSVNGVEEEKRKVSSEVLKEPVAQVVRVGAKPRKETPGEPAAGQPAVQPAGQKSKQAAKPPDRTGGTGGTDGLNWQALARCEAGGRTNAVDPTGTYGGLYQFDIGTWRGVGGSGRPQDATAVEQTYRAQLLYAARGVSAWPHCGPRLHQ